MRKSSIHRKNFWTSRKPFMVTSSLPPTPRPPGIFPIPSRVTAKRKMARTVDPLRMTFWRMDPMGIWLTASAAARGGVPRPTSDALRNPTLSGLSVGFRA